MKPTRTAIVMKGNTVFGKETEMKRDEKGQSTLEYIILVTAVVMVILAFAKGQFSTALNTTLGSATQKMTTTAASWH